MVFLGQHSQFYSVLVQRGSSLFAHDQQLCFHSGYLQDVYFAILFENQDLEVSKELNELKNANWTY